MTGLSSHGRPVEVLRYMVPDGFSASHAASLASVLSLSLTVVVRGQRRRRE
jgi:hypothetical protein